MNTQSSGQAGSKSPLIAVVLAFLYPGLGHVYLRRWGRALLWFVAIIATLVLLVPEAAMPAELSVGAVVEAQEAVPYHVAALALVLSVLSVVDAYRIAARSGDPHEQVAPGDGETASCPNCGKELDEDIDFCHWCTTELDTYES